MSILSREEAKKIMEKALSFSKADGCETNLSGSEDGNVRYARNSVSTSGNQNDLQLFVESNFGKRSASTSINEFDDVSLEKVVRRSEELARLAPENPEFMEHQEQPKKPYKDSKMYVPKTTEVSAEYRAEVSHTSTNLAKKNKVVSSGFFENTKGFSAMLNKKGLFAYRKNTEVSFTATMRTEDGTGSGWSSRDFNDVSLFDAKEASEVAIEKALMSRNPKAIEPGKYTVILEPNATWGLLNRLVYSMSARSADEGRSFLSKKGGGNKLGEKIVDEKVHIYSDPLNTQVPGPTWAGNGTPIETTEWIKNGVVENLIYSRYWAEKSGKKEKPLRGSIIMDGGSVSLDDLVKNTKRGILVTKLWYIRSVDPQTLLHTGLTRDGTFFVENGKIKHPIKNFRFNESPLIMLNNLEALGEQKRVNGNLIPALKIRDFTFTSLSDAI